MTPDRHEVRVDAGEVRLEGDLRLPEGAKGLVMFAHGSGSSRHSPRNQYVAGILREAGLGTLLLDLLSPDEEQLDLRTRHLRFDIDLLARRLVGASDWLTTRPDTRDLKLGLFGASTGAGAALKAAAARPEQVHAVVSRSGRPDLAHEALPNVRTPTLLIVGERDVPVLGLNERAKAQMPGMVVLEIIPSASHLFEEAGTLERAASLAQGWFRQYLG